MVSGRPSADGHERLLCALLSPIGQQIIEQLLGWEREGAGGGGAAAATPGPPQQGGELPITFACTRMSQRSMTIRALNDILIPTELLGNGLTLTSAGDKVPHFGHSRF